MKSIILETGQNLIDIAIQEYGTLEATDTICKDNTLAFDTDLFAGQVLLIREKGVDDMPFYDEAIIKAYQRRSSADKPYLVNSRTPGAYTPSPGEITDLPTFYGAGSADLDEAGILELTKIFRKKKETDNVPYTANMQRLWYVYPIEFGILNHAYLNGGYDAFTSFDILTITLQINGTDVDYYAQRLKHDTFLTVDDNLTISFQ